MYHNVCCWDMGTGYSVFLPGICGRHYYKRNILDMKHFAQEVKTGIRSNILDVLGTKLHVYSHCSATTVAIVSTSRSSDHYGALPAWDLLF